LQVLKFFFFYEATALLRFCLLLPAGDVWMRENFHLPDDRESHHLIMTKETQNIAFAGAANALSCVAT